MGLKPVGRLLGVEFIEGKTELRPAVPRMAAMLRKLREERRISQRQLADEARVSRSIVHRVERGSDANLSTWDKLFTGLGYYLLFDVVETCEEARDLLIEESDRRKERRWEGLCAARRRF